MPNRNKQKGFTLIETLLVLFMFSVGMWVLASMFLSQNRLYISQTTELNVTAALRFALDDIDNHVRQANRTLSDQGSYTASAQTLILQIQSVSSTNNLIPATFDYVVYSLSGSSLTREIIADAASARDSSTRQIANCVSDLDFTLNNGDYALVTEVITDITCQEQAGKQIRSASGSTKTKLRNY